MKHETLVKYTKNFPTFFPLKWEKSWAESSLVKLRSNYILPDTAKLKPTDSCWASDKKLSLAEAFLNLAPKLNLCQVSADTKNLKLTFQPFMGLRLIFFSRLIKSFIISTIVPTLKKL